MQDLPSPLPAFSSLPAAAVTAKPCRRRLRLSVSGLAVLCALGAAAIPGAALAQPATGIDGQDGNAGVDGAAGLGGDGSVTNGQYSNTGGMGGVGQSGAGSVGLGANGSGGEGGAPPSGSAYGSISGGGGGAGGGPGNLGYGGGGGGGSGDYGGTGGGGGGGGGGAGSRITTDLSNTGGITGGDGGNGGDGQYVQDNTGFGGGGGGGGAGVYAGGSLNLINTAAGAINGGGGGYGGFGGNDGYGAGAGGGNGGAGIGGLGFTLQNQGAIQGGGGGYGGFFSGYGGAGGAGGAGIDGNNFTAGNTGTITGGAAGNGAGGYYGGGGGGVGGAGVTGGGFVLTNSGTITGGAGGIGGAGTLEEDTIVRADIASLALTPGTGGTGSDDSGGGGGAGGAGIGGSGFSVTNSGAIAGGAGGAGGAGYAREGDLAVTADATAYRGGGAGGGSGGAGIAGTGFSVTNSGAITGGAGGAGGAGAGIQPAIAADLQSDSDGGGGGQGGAGVSGSGFTLANTGSITGGNGGAQGSSDVITNAAGPDIAGAGPGGAGIVSTGGASITTSGRIAGGLAGDSLAGDGVTQADAVDLSGGGNRLTLENGYSLTGNVVSTSGTADGGDTLGLGGSGTGHFNLSDLAATPPAAFTGTAQFYGFNTVETNGSATWVLTGTGTANVSVGTGALEVGDAANPGTVLNGAVSVSNLGTLLGHGTIDGNVLNDGVVQPGGSIGKLTVANYTQGASGALNIEITPSTVAGTGYDQLVVTGAASLRGTLNVKEDAGAYDGGSLYDIVHTGGGVTGRFSTVNVSKPIADFFTTTVLYGADDVLLELSLFDRSIFATGRLYAAGNFAQNNAVLETLTAISGPAADDETDRGYWVHGIGSFGTANGYDINSKGFVVGKGFDVRPDLVVGGAVSNVYTSTAGGGSDVRGNSVGLLLYGIYTQGPLTVSASFGAGHLGSTFQRTMAAQGVTGQSSSNGTYEGTAAHVQYALLNNGPYFLAPYGTANYLHTLIGSAQETGAGALNLRYDGMQTSLAQFGAGVLGGYILPVSYGTLTAWASLGGEGTLGNPHIGDTETVLGFSGRVNALAAPVGAVTPAAGVALAGRGPWSAAAYWSGQYGSATTDENFGVQAKYAW